MCLYLQFIEVYDLVEFSLWGNHRSGFVVAHQEGDIFSQYLTQIGRHDD
jgi:hypothetical protein